MKIAILLGTDGTDVRSAKICRSLARLGHEVHFVGWDRRDSRKEFELDRVRFHLMEHKVPLGKSTLWAQLKFTLFSLQQLRAIRPEVVYAVNEDNVLRALLFYKLYYKHILCDFYDSHADRFSEKPFAVRWPIQAVSHLCKTLANQLVVTDHLRWERLGKYKNKAIVIGNVPEDPGSHLSRNLPTGNTKILVTGAMSKSRGLEQILRGVENSPETRIVAAGRASDAYAENIFLKHDQVDYQGVVTPHESLELAASCDAVFAFYAPTSQNHIYASPNKLFDAMCVGRPVIINSEVKMSQLAADTSLGLLCPYDDIKGLQSIVSSLDERRAHLASFAASARKCYVENHSWKQMEGILGNVFKQLNGGTCSTRRIA